MEVFVAKYCEIVWYQVYKYCVIAGGLDESLQV